MLERRLFFERMMYEWKEERKVLSTVFDWTIVLYLVIPFLLFCSYTYFSWWTNPPSYLFSIHIILPMLIAIITNVYGSFRNYVEEADLLFLSRRPSFSTKLDKWGWLVTFCFGLLQLLIIHFLLAPIIVHNEMFTITQYILFIMVTFLHYLFVKVWKKQRKQFLRRYGALIFFHLLLYFFLISFQTTILFSLISLCIMSSMLVLMFLQVNKQDIQSIISYEQGKKGMFTRLVYQFSYEIEKDQGKKDYLPLFKKSKRYFTNRHKSFVRFELFIKLFFRSKTFSRGYANLMMVTVASIVLLPFWLKLLIILLFYFFLRYWFLLLWQKIWSHSGHAMFVSVVDLENLDKDYTYSYWLIFALSYSLISVALVASYFL